MRPEYYADLYRRFAEYLRNYGGNKLIKVACGNYGDKKNCFYTDTVMRIAASKMQGLSIHYYCGSGKGRKLTTQFDMEDWFLQMQRALRLEEIIKNNIAAMDKYDPEKKVGLLVDEWGTWHKTEPGTHPRFLYMQSTLHDALVAGLSLNIFNNYCNRVKMANIAQTVNVLQSMVLTEGEKMLLTPTYYVFKMYTVHHDSTLLPTELNCSDYTFGDAKIPSVNVSASKDNRGKIHITLCNLDPENPVMLNCELKGCNTKKVTGQILTDDDINAHNTFEKPDAIKAQSYKNASIKGNILTVALPAKSVVALEIE
jgi:alpha-N-arabinofuranosidase